MFIVLMFYSNPWETEVVGVYPTRDAARKAIEDAAKEYDDGWTWRWAAYNPDDYVGDDDGEEVGFTIREVKDGN
jgi:hypothetical protein